jgi:predicted dehydrogenase
VRLDYGVSGMAWREVGNARTLLARNPKDPGMIATRYVFEKTLEAFRTNGSPPASAQDARDVLEVIAACYHAAATGKRISLDGSAPELASMRMGSNPAA